MEMQNYINFISTCNGREAFKGPFINDIMHLREGGSQLCVKGWSWWLCTFCKRRDVECQKIMKFLNVLNEPFKMIQSKHQNKHVQNIWCTFNKGQLTSLSLKLINWHRGYLWSWRKFTHSKTSPLHLGQVDLCNILKCGILGCIKKCLYNQCLY
jgi:hypothetical protein